MDVDANTKKRKRVDGVGTSDVEDASDASAPGQVTPAVPAKKALDIAALKAKLAEGKKKVEEIKKTTPAAAPIIALPSAQLPAPDVQRTAPTTSANARYLKEQEEKRQREQHKQERAQAKTQAESKSEAPDSSFDPRMKRAVTERKARPLVFLQAGELTKKAEVQNDKITKWLEGKQEPVSNLPPPRRSRPSADQTPVAEWWDLPYYVSPPQLEAQKVKQESAMDIDSATFNQQALREDLITLLIQHPILTKPLAEAPPPPERALMLTPEEAKKLKKQKRRLELETRRDEVLLGIRPAEKGKMRLSTMVKTFSESITDPTLVEKKVLEEKAIREARHEARNQERKLAPEQRKEKEKAKLYEDTSLSSHVAVFRILSLANAKNRFKLNEEVKYNNLSGVAVYSSDFVVLAVEGGPKAIARFTKKMLKKMPWKQPLPPPREADKIEEDKDNQTGNAEQRIYGKSIDPEQNECHLVWTGEVLRRAFTEFRFVGPAKGARAYLDSLGVAHYYDSAKSYVPPDVVL